MIPSDRSSLALLFLAVSICAFAGCTNTRPKAQPPAPRYTTLPPKNLPAFMKGTILEAADIENKDAYPVSGFGLVVGLDHTGDNNGCPQSIRGSIINEMVRHGFGSTNERLKNFNPEAMLRDDKTAIVEVYAYLPPGGRTGQRVDVYVQAQHSTQTRSIARGHLYQTRLFVGGADPLNPSKSVNPFVTASGAVFVTPTYLNSNSATNPSEHATLRNGTIMAGGVLTDDRPLKFRARNPQLSITRSIEARIDQRFQENIGDPIARTEDEAMVSIFVPRSFNGDWEHFIGVAAHLYLDATPGTGSIRARTLAAEAVKPGAMLMDISYCWEGIGDEALPVIQKLYTHASPEVAFAAARAGAFIGGSPGAEQTLLEIAHAENNPFQLNAVKVLGNLPASPRIDRMLSELLSTRNALVRIEAYRVLAEHESAAVMSKAIDGQFAIDQITTEGPPLMYATRTGIPRIAIFGNLSLNLPIMYTTMQDQLTISTAPSGKGITIFDRSNSLHPGGISANLRPDVYEMIWRLAGGSDDGFKLGYSDLVGILQGLSAAHHIPATFVLQDLPSVQDKLEDAAPILDPKGNPTIVGSASADGRTK